MPDEEKEKNHPRAWTFARLVEWSQNTAFPLTEDSTPDEINKARGKAASELMHKGKTEKAEAMKRVKERVKMHYEMGTAMQAICKSYAVRSRDVEKWAVTEKWTRPEEPEPAPEEGAASPLLVDEEFGIVTRETEEKMPTAVRAMREQQRLMNLRGKQWEKVPYEMWPAALRMRLAGQVRRAIERFEQMDEDELMADMKGLKTLAETLEKVAPIPEDGGGKKTLLHVSMYNGDDGLPIKRAAAMPVLEAEVVPPSEDPMF